MSTDDDRKQTCDPPHAPTALVCPIVSDPAAANGQSCMTLHPMPEAIREAFERCRDMDASLTERLETFAQEIRQLNPAFQAAVDRFVSRLRNADAGAAAPQVGEAMPGFLLPDHAGHLVNLEDLLEKGPVALTLHRGHWCPYLSRRPADRSSRSSRTCSNSPRSSRPKRMHPFRCSATSTTDTPLL